MPLLIPTTFRTEPSSMDAASKSSLPSLFPMLQRCQRITAIIIQKPQRHPTLENRPKPRVRTTLPIHHLSPLVRRRPASSASPESASRRFHHRMASPASSNFRRIWAISSVLAPPGRSFLVRSYSTFTQKRRTLAMWNFIR
jgi:hypothetical protein